MERRVVITACAAITPIGNTEAGMWDALVHGRSGVKALKPDELLSKYIHSGAFGTVDYPIAYEFERQHR
ncbi:MAG TPA: beta-ketoacyl synthase N-terminal-like domain-containing protein, partial [Myxococcota bacterium]|nr:beta-ketoacyl synthase N-terminal-like domain-containing protein [Myxococcota bacterium]